MPTAGAARSEVYEMGSWGHQIVETVTSWVTGLPSLPSGRGRGCRKPAEVFLRYAYLTGRRGRVSTGTRALCRACAEAAVARAAGNRRA